MSSDSIVCSVKVLCSEELEVQKQHKWAMENFKSTNQCPALQEENLPRKLYFSLPKNNYVSHALQFVVSAMYQIFGKV